MAEVEETKDGKLNIFCDCGLVHKVSEDQDGKFVIETKYKKAAKIEDDPEKKETKRESFFSRHYEKNQGKK